VDEPITAILLKNFCGLVNGISQVKNLLIVRMIVGWMPRTTKESYFKLLLNSVLVQAIVATILLLLFVMPIEPGFAAPAIAHPANLANSQINRILIPMALFSFSGSRPDHLGVENGKLSPCPDSPNCVSSQSDDAEHGIAALSYKSSPEQVMAELKQIVSNMPRTEIISDRPDYLYVEFTSSLMGFVDDVEFYLNPEQHVVEVRSASRLGKSDMGVNRKRVESIRTELDKIESDLA
jgi:uncharacterized protein (DUF1499 family)